MVHPLVDLDQIPLANRDFKIHETISKFDLFDIYYWWEDKFVDGSHYTIISSRLLFRLVA